MSSDKKPFDFQERATLFARRIRTLVKKAPRTIGNIEDCKQLVRSSGSVGANYIEASEGLSKKDSLKSLRISRKEAKESTHWLTLLEVQGDALKEERSALIIEVKELVCILTSIIKKVGG